MGRENCWLCNLAGNKRNQLSSARCPKFVVGAHGKIMMEVDSMQVLSSPSIRQVNFAISQKNCNVRSNVPVWKFHWPGGNSICTGPVVHTHIPLLQNIMPLPWPICAQWRPRNATNKFSKLNVIFLYMFPVYMPVLCSETSC